MRKIENRHLRLTLIMNASRAIVSSAPFVFSDVFALVSAKTRSFAPVRLHRIAIPAESAHQRTNKSTAILACSCLTFCQRHYTIQQIDLISYKQHGWHLRRRRILTNVIHPVANICAIQSQSVYFLPGKNRKPTKSIHPVTYYQSCVDR